MAVKEGHTLAVSKHDVEFVNSDGLREYAKAGVATEFPNGEYQKLVDAGSIPKPKNATDKKELERKLQEGPLVDPQPIPAGETQSERNDADEAKAKPSKAKG